MKRIWKRYLAALLVFTMVLNSTGATVLAETVRNGLVSHVQMKNTAQNLGLASGSNQINEEGELASTSDASSSDADIPCTKNDDCEALPGNHDIECPLYEGELLDDVSTPSNAILAMGFSEEDAALQYQQGKVGMTLEEVAFPETMVLNLKDLETGEEYEEETPVTWRLAQPADLAEFDTNLHTLLDEDGNPILDEKGMPVRDLLSYTWIFTPVLENSEDYDWSFLPDGYDSWNTYQEEQAGVRVEIGIMNMAEDPWTIHLGNNELTGTGHEDFWTYDAQTKTITLLQDGTYNILPASNAGDSLLNGKIVVGTANSTLSDVTVNLHDVTLSNMLAPVLDFSNVAGTVELKLYGASDFTSRSSLGTVVLPGAGTLIVSAGDENGTLTVGNTVDVAIKGVGKENSALQIKGGNVSIKGGSMSAYSVTDASVVIDEAAVFEMQYFVSDNNTEFEGNILDASFQAGTMSTSVLNIKGGSGDSAVDRKIVMDNTTGFMTNLPAGSYRITTVNTDGGTGTFSGQKKDDTTGRYVVSYKVNGHSIYTNLQQINLSVFSENKVVDNSITFNSVKLESSVNTEGEHSVYPNDTYYIGTYPILDKGFVIYESDKTTVLGYYNANGLMGTTTYKYIAETADPENEAYEVAVEGLTAGAKYYFKPYAYTKELGLRIVDEYNVEYNVTAPALKNFTLPKVDYPDQITFTYGAITGDFGGEELFPYDAANKKVTINLPMQGEKSYQAFWAFTNPDNEVIPDADDKVGSTIPGHYELGYKTAADETFHSWAETTVDAGTYNSSTDKKPYIRFVPEEENLYNIPEKPITLVVNKAGVKPVGLDGYTKVFDGNANAVNTTKVLVGPLVENDDLQGGDNADTVYATFTAATYNDPEVEKANQITVTGLSLAGDKKDNYVLTGFTEVDRSFVFNKTNYNEIEILPKPIYLSLETEKVRSGEKWKEVTIRARNEADWVEGHKLTFEDFNFFYGQDDKLVTDWNQAFPTIDLERKTVEPKYTVEFSLKDTAPQNYEATLNQGNVIWFYQETPNQTSGDPAEFTLTGTRGSNNYYKDDLVIKPAMKAYYDKVLDVTSDDTLEYIEENEKASLHNKAKAELCISQTTENVRFRLYNSETGAFTKIYTLGEVKVDKKAPEFNLDTIRYTAGKENNNVKDLINFLSFGIFFNEKVTVKIDVRDDVSGIDTNAVYYHIGDTPAEHKGTKAFFTPAADGGNKSGTISFEIDADKELVQFCAHDMAGNETGWVTLRKDGDNHWLIEDTPPAVGEIAFNQQITSSGWYNKPVTASSVITDVAGANKEFSGIHQIQWITETTKTKSDSNPVEESGDEQIYDHSPSNAIESTIFEKKFSQDAVSITLKVRAQDNATNWSGNADAEYTEATFKLDTTAPGLTTPAVRYGEESDDSDNRTYYKQAVLFFDVSDATSGVTKVEISSDNGTTWTDASGGAVTEQSKVYNKTEIKYVVTENGTYQIRVTDEAGNVTTSAEITVDKVDKLRPQIPTLHASLNGDAYGEEWNDSAWKNADVTLYIQAKDAEATDKDAASGIDSWQYSLDGGTTWLPETPNSWENIKSFVIDKNGDYTNQILVQVKDVAGNTDTGAMDGNPWVESKAYTVKLDESVGTLNVAGTLEGEAEGSFVSGEWTNKTITFKLEYQPKDGTPQTSGLTYEIKVGTGADAKWGSINNAGAGYAWDDIEKTLTITGDHCDDIQFRVTTESGLSTAVMPTADTYYKVRQTQTPLETVTAQLTEGEKSNTDWYYEGSTAQYSGKAPTITIPLSKTLEGHAPITTVYKYWPESLGKDEPTEDKTGVVVREWTKDQVDAMQEENPQASFSFPADGAAQGQYYYMVWQEDEAGNKSASVTQLVKVDTVDPTTETPGYRFTNTSEFAEFVRKVTFGVFFKETIEVLVPVEDTNSGMASVTFQVSKTEDGASPKTTVVDATDFVTFTDAQGIEKTAASILLPLGTKAYIRYSAKDNAGNQTEEQNLLTEGDNLLIVESDAPVVFSPEISGEKTTATAADKENTAWYTGDVTVKALVQDMPANSDAASGLSRISYEIGRETDLNYKSGEIKYDTELVSEATFNGDDVPEDEKVLVDFDGEIIPVSISAEDNAGNISEKNTIYLAVDRTKPEIVGDELNESQLQKPTNSQYPLLFKIIEETSGLQPVKVYLLQDGPASPATDISDQFKETTAGEYALMVKTNGTYQITATDVAGNVSTHTFEVNNFDTVPPTVNGVSFDKKPNDNGVFVDSEIGIIVDAVDTDPNGGYASGVDYYRFALDTTSGITDPQQLQYADGYYYEDPSKGERGKLTTSGRWYLYILQYDAAGNETLYQYPTQIVIDNGIPDLTIVDEAGYFENVSGGKEGPWTKQPVTIGIESVADETTYGANYKVKEPENTGWTDINLASSEKGEHVLSSGVWKNTQMESGDIEHTFTISPDDGNEGKLSYQFHVDKVSAPDQYKESAVYTVKLDNTAPKTPLADVEEPEKSGWYTTAPTLKLEVQTTDVDGKPEGDNTAPVTVRYKMWKEGEEEPDDGTQAGKSIDLLMTDGITHVEYWAQDEAGNTSKSETKEFKVDTQAPAIVESITVEPVDSALGAIVNQIFGNFFKGDLKVTVTISDNGDSGIDRLDYTLADDEADPTGETRTAKYDAASHTATFTLPVNGIDHRYLTVTLYDKAGNSVSSPVKGGSQSAVWTVENGVPTIETVEGSGKFTAPAPNEAKWYNKPVELTATIKDSSGLRKVEWGKTVNGNSTKETLYETKAEDTEAMGSYDFAKTIEDEGRSIMVAISAEDNATNTWGDRVILNIDKTAPVINEGEINADIPTQWQNTNREISFTITDALSKVDKSTIKVEKGSKDSAGNFIPLGELLKTTITETEATSNTYNVAFTTKGYGWYQVSVEDVADNTDEYVFEVKPIDLIAPTEPSVTVVPDSADGSEGWYVNSPTLSITGSTRDANKGENEQNSSEVFTKYQLWYTEIADNLKPTEAPAGTETKTWHKGDMPKITESGYWHILIWGEDEAGNKTYGDPIYNIKVDVNHPTVGIPTYTEKNTGTLALILNQLTFGNFFNQALKVSIPVSDLGYSGVKELRYQKVPLTAEGNPDKPENETWYNADITGEGTPNATAEFEIPMNYDGAVIYYVKDIAGNQNVAADGITAENKTLKGAKGSNRWVSDAVKPEIRDWKVQNGVTANVFDWYKQEIPVEFTVTDMPNNETVHSGLASITWNGTAQPLYADGQTTANSIVSEKTNTVTVTEEGAHDYIITAVDNAGNEAVSVTKELKLDTKKPDMNQEPAADFNTPTADPILVTYELSDETSKLVKDSITVKMVKEGVEIPKEDADLKEEIIVPSDGTEETVTGKDGITALVSNKYGFSFTVKECATYTVTAKDLAGNEITETIEVKNINTTGVKNPDVKVNDSTVIAPWYSGTYPTIGIENREPALEGMWYILQQASEPAPEKTDEAWADAEELTFKWGEDDSQISVEPGDASAATNPPKISADGQYKLYIKTLQDTKEVSFRPVVTINVDTKKPVISYENSDLPTTWVTEEQIIRFSITDEQEEASKVKENSIVLKKLDEAGTEVFTLTRVTDEPENPDETLKPGEYFIKANSATGGFDGYFKTNGNGTYTIAASDVAGNGFAEGGNEYKKITVKWIDTDAPDPAPKIKATVDATGNDVATAVGKKWYTQIPTLDWTTAKLNTDEAAEGTPGTSEVTSTYEKYEGTDISGTAKETFEFTNDVDKKTPTVEDGIWTFKTWAEDEAGHTNEADAHVSTYWVDTTRPTIAVSYNPNVTTSGTVTITVTLMDATSKIDTDSLTVTKVDGMDVPADLNLTQGDDETTYQFTIEVDKNSEYTINVKDKAGNAADSATAKVTWIDTSIMPIAPVMYGSKQLNPETTVGWYKEPVNKVTVEKAESTETAQIHTTVTVTKPDGTEEKRELQDGKTTSTEFTLNQDGIWKIQTYSEKQVTPVTEVDRRTDTYTIMVDTKAPDISEEADITITNDGRPTEESNGKTNWTNGLQTVTFRVTDSPKNTADTENAKAVSGVKTVTVTTENGAFEDGKTGSQTLTKNPDGSYSFKAAKNGTYTINAWDAAKDGKAAESDEGGNKAAPVNVTIDRIDTTKPADITENNVDVDGPHEEGNDWYKEKLPTITITGPGNDNGAPLEVWWKLEHKATDETLDEEYQEIGMAQYGDDADNNEQIPELTMDGVYRLTVWTEDEAGNRSATDFVKVIKVDTKAPEPVENGIIITPTGSNPLEKIGNFLTFGNFFKEDLKVTVTAEDATSGTECLYSSVDTMSPGELMTTDQNRTEMEDGKASFNISSGSPGRYAKFKLKDKAGNVSVIHLVKGKKGSDKWTIDEETPEITDFKATSNSNSVGWYNTSVNFTATVTDTESYLNKVDWIVSGDAEKAQDKQEGDATHNLFTRRENAPAGEPNFTVNQTITADGQTTVDIAAKDNALNVATLSNAQPDAVRTIKIDTKKPVIQYVSGNPDKWTSKEQTITFTVTDTPKTEGILHSGVDDDTVTVDFKKSSGNQDAEEGELDLLSREQNGNTWTYTFQTRGNGTYTFTAMDIAGNAAEKVTITVDKINSTNLEAPGTDEKGNRGYVKWNEHTGEDYKDSSDSVIGWYANGKNPEITIRNSHAGPDDMPIYTVYKLWNTANNEPEMFKQIGFDESSLNPKTVTITDGINWTDGTWKLAAWNIPAAGAPSPRAEWTFMVDNTAPTVSETPEELKEINTDGWQKLINKLTFGLFYKEAIQVTVQVEDATSHGETLYYQIETEKDGKQELVTGDAKIRLTDDNSTIGYAKFTLPIGTKGKIAMWAEDFAGNVSAKLDEQNNLIPESGQVYLGYNGATWWELENTAPVITEISPVMDEKDVSVYLQGIVLTFNERVTAAEGKTVTISTGGEYYDYTLTEEDTKQIYLASPANADTGMDTPENVHGTYKVTLPINKFAERTTGESLSLSYNTDYIIRAEKGAFLDLATNEQVGGVYSVFTTEDDSKAEVPTIADLDVTGGQFIQIYPEFSSDNTEYVIVVADGALNEDKTQLAQDLILKAALTGDVELTEAVLKNFMGVTIDDDLSIQDTAAGSNVIVSADLIQAKENYILQFTISDHGKEQTYTFYVSTSAVTASTDYLTSGMPKVQVDTDELLVSLANEDLAQYLQKGLKVNIRMDISAPSLDSIPEEEAAFNALRTAMGETEKNITYYPFDFTIWKAVSNGEMEKITRLRQPITITIPIPSRIDLEDFRDVYRYHDGVPYKVQFTLNEAARTVTFEADEFSVYALAYYKEPSYSGGGGGGGGTGGGGGGGVVNVGSQVAYYGGAWQNDGWMFIKSDGTKPVNEWLNIDGKIYRFGLDGFMTTSFEKYQFNNDGSLAPASAAVVKAQAPIATGTWLRDGWRYKTLSKTYLSGGWYYLYYNGLFDWYYFNDEGWMLDGWFAYGGETYYLHTTHDWSRGRMYMGWQVIDGKWYYFRMKADGKEGTLMRNSYTPDGHFVGADGAWDGRGSAPTAYVRK